MLTFNKLGHYGRLGNQMFQYASLMGIATNRGFDFGIKHLNRHESVVCNPLVGPEQLDLFDAFDNLTAKDSLGILRQFDIAREPSHEFNEAFFNEIPDGCDLVGYFQTEKYFKNCEEQVRKEFTFKDEIVSKSKEVMGGLEAKDRPTVSLHIRRGDYTKIQDFHPLCTVGYYLDALAIVGDEYYPVVFSDDIEWCKNNLCLDEAFYSVGNNQYVDMCAMSMCDSNVIANSSYSWWSAWLNGNKDKTVVAPDKWFGKKLSHKNTNDKYCEGWIRRASSPS
jgi:hypothetical protein